MEIELIKPYGFCVGVKYVIDQLKDISKKHSNQSVFCVGQLVHNKIVVDSLKELDVKEGQMVKQGELLGKSGATGLATGPHLHWEIRLNMAAVRPEFFLQDFAHQNNNN